jgi:pilus assembly protein CpaB
VTARAVTGPKVPGVPSMKPARLAVLGIALVAGLGAVWMMQGDPPPPPAPAPVAAPSIPVVDVLVAAADLPMGQTVKAQDLRWQAWPQDSAGLGVLRRSEAPDGLEQTAGSIVRQAFLAGEPIRREKLIKADGSGFMSAILPSGMRAVAISIDTRGSTSAGGFILPNDRVDLVRVYRDDGATKAAGIDVQAAEVVLANVRVLAIGQTVQERNGEKVVTGETATLELTPQQVEVVLLAQRTGQLTLALRSLADANRVETKVAVPEPVDSNLTVVRYGVSTQTSKR